MTFEYPDQIIVIVPIRRKGYYAVDPKLLPNGLFPNNLTEYRTDGKLYKAELISKADVKIIAIALVLVIIFALFIYFSKRLLESQISKVSEANIEMNDLISSIGSSSVI